jgi:F-type H+-transporting ATPase subunit b
MNAMNALLASEEGPNVLAVPLDELILGIVAFLIVFAALAKLALPGIRKALEERTAAIEGGIARAEAREAEATAMYEQYQAQLAEARTEAAQIRAQAQADKAAMIEEARAEAAEAAAAVTARAEASIAAERASTVASLRREVGTLAVSLAGKVVGESLEDDARARATVDRFIADLEAQAAGTGS